MADTTEVKQSKYPNNVHRGDDSTESNLGLIEYQIFDPDNENITFYGTLGHYDLGMVSGANDPTKNISTYIQKGGLPEVSLGVEKIGEDMQVSINLTHLSDIGEQLVEGTSIDYEFEDYSPAISSTVNGAAGDITKSSVYLQDASSFAVGNRITFIEGDSTYGTRRTSTRIKSITGNKITFVPPLSQLPEDGSAVVRIKSKTQKSGGDLPKEWGLRRLEHSNSDGSIRAVKLGRAAKVITATGIQKNEGNVPRSGNVTFEILPDIQTLTIDGCEQECAVFTEARTIYKDC